MSKRRPSPARAARGVPSGKKQREPLPVALPLRWTPLSLGLLAPVLLVAGALALGYLWNEDFWWYLSSGEAILKNRGIPATDPFLYTSAGTSTWVYHSWLWTVAVALLHQPERGRGRSGAAEPPGGEAAVRRPCGSGRGAGSVLPDRGRRALARPLRL